MWAVRAGQWNFQLHLYVGLIAPKLLLRSRRNVGCSTPSRTQRVDVMGVIARPNFGYLDDSIRQTRNRRHAFYLIRPRANFSAYTRRDRSQMGKDPTALRILAHTCTPYVAISLISVPTPLPYP